MRNDPKIPHIRETVAGDLYGEAGTPPSDDAAEHARLREINPGYCPNGLHLVVSDYNVFPQRMWGSDTQRWHCETCAALVTRTLAGGRWSRWELVTR